MSGIVDLQFTAQTSNSVTELQKILEKLKEINGLSTLEMKVNNTKDDDKIINSIKKRLKMEQDLEVKSAIETQKLVIKAQEDLIKQRKFIAGKQFQQSVQENIINSGGTGQSSANKSFYAQQEKDQLTLLQNSANEKKRIEKEALDNKAQLLKLENTLIRNNMSDTLRMSLNNLKNKKDLNRQELKDFEDKVNRQLALNQKASKVMTEGRSEYAFSKQLVMGMRQSVVEAAKFEKTLYHMGVVGEKGVAQIDDMRSAMYNLGREIPRATQEIVENIIKVETMGYTYEQSLGVVRESAKLAVASGEGIAKSTDVLTKILVAFNIESERTAEVMNSVHTSVVRTPLDLQKIDEAMRNAGSGMRNFIESTNKSGDELERYKIQILNTTLALTGGMTKMGMTASSAGVAIRNLGTKMIVMEKTAANMFNRNMDLANSFHDVNEGLNNSGKGFKITSDYISQLAQRDAPQAIELLSQLYKQGDVSLKTLVKIFTIKMFDFHSGNTMSKVA